MTAAARLDGKALDLDETLGDGIDGEEETFQSDGSKQRWPTRSDEARSRDLTSVDGETHFGDGPGLPAPSGRLNRLMTLRDEPELVGDGAWNDEERRSGVHQHVDRRCPTGRASDSGGNVEQSHIADSTAATGPRKCRDVDTGRAKNGIGELKG